VPARVKPDGLPGGFAAVPLPLPDCVAVVCLPVAAALAGVDPAVVGAALVAADEGCAVADVLGAVPVTPASPAAGEEELWHPAAPSITAAAKVAAMTFPDLSTTGRGYGTILTVATGVGRR